MEMYIIIVSIYQYILYIYIYISSVYQYINIYCIYALSVYQYINIYILYIYILVDDGDYHGFSPFRASTAPQSDAGRPAGPQVLLTDAFATWRNARQVGLSWRNARRGQDM